MRYNIYFILLFLITASLFLITSCSSSKNPQLYTTLHAADFLNPNIYNKASPVVVILYQLKTPTSFNQANFFAIYNNPTQTLGSDLLDKREVEIQPQQHLLIQQTLSPNANYLGIIAAFRDPDSAQWRSIIQLPHKKKINIQIAVEAQSILATKK